MAESTMNKNKKSRDSFADDLDSMLDINDSDNSQVGLIDDDDAIDRLLIGDAFADTESASNDFDPIERMMAEMPVAEHLGIDDIDEFGDDVDDMIAKLDITPKKEADTVDDSSFDLVEELELDAFDIVAEGETMPLDDTSVDPVEIPVANAVPNEDADKMSEIDEFSDDSSQLADNADFLLADFNISSDDEFAAESPPAASTLEKAVMDNASVNALFNQGDDAQTFADDTESLLVAAANRLEPDVEPVPEPRIEVAPNRAAVDHSAALASLTAQIQSLAKLHKQTQHDLQLKVDNDALTQCLETVETLQTEQKKARRNLDGLLNQKPTGVYIANGVAGLAMLVAIGLGVETYITKSQLSQVVEVINQLKQQTVDGPTADAAAAELLRKQIDELNVAQTVLGNQVSELTKAMQIGPATGKPLGDQAEINDRDMQMGAAIEALQTKVAALEKSRVAVAVPKVLPKPVIEENWVVNLVAFKQDWYARRKGEEFAVKGIPAKVTRSDSKGETWFRLSVDGFKSQYDAAIYAAKAKKTLNLDSVWVSKNKE